MDLRFEHFSEELFTILLGKSPTKQLQDFSDRLESQGLHRKYIYHVLLEFHKAIQVDPRTKDNEYLYDVLSDFMDTLVD